MKEIVQLFQVGDKTIVGIVSLEDEMSMDEKEIVYEVIVEKPMLLIELVSVSAIDQSRPVLQRQLKPFFGNPKSMAINIESIDWFYGIEDTVLINEYKNITNQIYQSNHKLN